jgi:hypothetical protein
MGRGGKRGARVPVGHAVVPLKHGLILQAGNRPPLGDISRGDYLPLMRKMARVLRPARTTLLADKSEFWHHFFNMFDKDA